MSRKTRKLMWSVPLVAVFAVVGALAMFAAQTPMGAQAQDAQETLGPPLELTATKDGRKVITLEWAPPATSPEDVTAYRVDVSEDKMVWMQLVPASAGLEDAFFDHTGLMPGDTRHYRVFAIYGTKKGEGEPSEVASATTDAATAPGKPEFSDLAFGTATPSDVSGLAPSWAAPSDDGGSPITGYKIERLKDGETAWMTAKADTGLTTAIVGANCADGTACVYQDTGLIQATKYHYRISAINKVGTGMPSDTESSTTAASTTGAAAPTGLTVQGSNAAVTLHWLTPGDPSGDPITGYKVERSADSTALTENPWVVIPTTGTRTSHFVGGAFSSGETPWHYRVTAVNAGGGDGLSTAAVTVGPPKASTHGPAQSLRARSEIPLTINVSWREASGSATVAGTTTYRVDYSTDNLVWQAGTGTIPTTADETSERYIYRDTGLKIGEKRYYRVIADTGGTLHQVTNVVSATAGSPGKPGKPTDLDVTTTPPTANMITLAWTAPTETGSSPITGYKIERSRDAATGWMTIKANTGNADTSYEDKNLPANTQYYYRVSAMNAARTGDASDTVSPKTAFADALSIPTGLVALDRGTSVDLYWVSPGDADGAPVTGYKIEVSEDGGTTWTTVEADTMSRDTMYTHTGLTRLTGDATRMYRVSAISSVGTTAPSLTDTAGPGAAPMAPGMPMNVTADKVAAMPTSQIKVSWSAPASGVVDGYIIERTYDDDMVGDIPSDGYSGENGANRNHAFMNYKEWWETLNCKGMLAVAEAADNAENRAMYCKHFLNTAPSNVTDSSTEISEATGMKVKDLFMKRYVSDDMGNTTTMFTGMMYTDMDLMASTEYTYRVRAIRGMMAGPWSATAMATTDSASTELTAPTNVRVSPGGTGELSFTWEGGDNADMVLLLAVDLSTVGTDEVMYDRATGDAATRTGEVSALTSGTQYLGIVVVIKGSGNAAEYLYAVGQTVTAP